MTSEAFLLSMQWLNGFLLHMVVKWALSMRFINPCVSHMPIACPFVWHASLVGSTWAVYVRRMSLIVLSVEFMFPLTSFWGKRWRFRTPIAFSPSSVLFQVLAFPYWTYNSMSPFVLTKQLTVFPFLISGLLWKFGDAGHRSRTSRMQSEHATIWATSLVRKRAANDIWSLSFVNAMVERFLIWL